MTCTTAMSRPVTGSCASTCRTRTWARSHNSLLLVTFDESDSHGGGNRIVTLLDGAGIGPGRVDEPVEHYRLLATIEAMYGCLRLVTPLTPLRSPTFGRAAEVRRDGTATGLRTRVSGWSTRRGGPTAAII